MNPPIPLSLLKDLRCRHCAKFVTCGPVHVVPEGAILCGRCRVLAKPKFQNFAYEAVASMFLYPCYNWMRHCNKILSWDESHDHERDCIYDSTCKLLCSHPGVICKSQRKLPEGGDINLEHVTEEILEILKCVTCESYLSCDPVHIGLDGRNLCHRCVTSNGIPPGVIRNLGYEKLASIIIFPCIYRFRGCTIRLRYGREMWKHEGECPYGQVFKKITKQLSKTGKERGVIETHSGHIYGTITPHSALFAPPKSSRTEDHHLTQELVNVIRKKQQASPCITDEGPKTPDYDRHQSFDSQSLESLFNQSVRSSMTRRSTEDPLNGNYNDYAQQKRTMDENFNDVGSQDTSVKSYKLSRDESLKSGGSSYYHPQDDVRVQKHSTDESLNSGYYQDPRYSHQFPSRSSSRPPTREEDRPRSSNDASLNSIPGTPTGYNPQPFSYYQENVARWSRQQNFDQQLPYLVHYPAMYLDEAYSVNDPNLKYSPSLNFPSAPYNNYHPNVAKRSESLRVGNREIIEELKARQLKKRLQDESQQNAVKENNNPYEKCNSLQDIVQAQDSFPE